MIKIVSAEPNTVILKLDLIILNLFSTKQKFMAEKNKVIIIIIKDALNEMTELKKILYKTIKGKWNKYTLNEILPIKLKILFSNIILNRSNFIELNMRKQVKITGINVKIDGVGVFSLNI